LRYELVAPERAPTYALAELASRNDAELVKELRAAGIDEARALAMMADLRRRAPYEDRAAREPLAVARMKLDRARVAIGRGDREAARAAVVDASLDGVEPVETLLRASDPALSRSIEERFMAVRGLLGGAADPSDVRGAIDAILVDLTRAEALLASGNSFL